jgi:hypothetical protein
MISSVIKCDFCGETADVGDFVKLDRWVEYDVFFFKGKGKEHQGKRHACRKCWKTKFEMGDKS